MEAIIDFDAASTAWMENKRKIGNGCYKYRCTATTKKGEPCKCKPTQHSEYCHRHQHLSKHPEFS